MELLDPEDRSGSPQMIVRVIYHDQIYLAVPQQLSTFHRCLIDHLDMSSGKCLVETLKIRDQEIAADRIAGSYADLPACRSGVDKLGFSLLDQVHGGLYMPHEDLSLGCELDFFRTAYEKGLI